MNFSSLGRIDSPTSYATRTGTVKLEPDAPKSPAQYRQSDLCLVDNPFKTFDIGLLRFILERKLKTIVPQIRCDYFQGLTQIYRQGIENLMMQPEATYRFYPPQAWQLAADIDTLLANDILHGGISPQAMVLFEENIYLFTGDAIGDMKSGRVQGFSSDLTMEQSKKIVKYNFFVSLMALDLRRIPLDVVFDPESISNFIEFIGTEPHYQSELFNFLTQPWRHDLSFPLVDYFGEGDAVTFSPARFESLDNIYVGKLGSSSANYFDIKDDEREVFSLTHHQLPFDEYPQEFGSEQAFLNQHFSEITYVNSISARIVQQGNDLRSAARYRSGLSVWELDKLRR